MRSSQTQPDSQAARVARARRDRTGKNWGAAYRAYEAALKEAPQDIELLNELEYVRQQMRPEMASRGFPYSRGERRPEEASRPWQFSRFGREPRGLGLSNYLPAFLQDVLPVVQPESLYFTDSNKLYGWHRPPLRRLLDHQGAAGPAGPGIPGIQPEHQEVKQGQLNLGLNPVFNQQTNAASRLRRLDASLGLGPLSVDDRLRLSGDLILRRYWRRDDFRRGASREQQRQSFTGYWVNFPIPHFISTAQIDQNLRQLCILPRKTPATASWAPWSWVFPPRPRTDATLSYSRRDIFDQESYLFPRLYQSVLNLTEARITTYQQVDLSYTHQFQPGLDWRGNCGRGLLLGPEPPPHPVPGSGLAGHPATPDAPGTDAALLPGGLSPTPGGLFQPRRLSTPSAWGWTSTARSFACPP